MADGTLDPRQLMRNGAGVGVGLGANTAARPQTNGDTSSHESRLRVPTVAEALPYSPFSSIVPFNADIMHAPLALPTTSPAIFHNDEAVRSTRRELERLTAGATSAENASERCKATINDIQKLLFAGNLTDYKFKSTKRVQASDDSSQPTQRPALSSFANMIYDGIKEPYRYLTPPQEPGVVEPKGVAPVRQVSDSQPQAANAASLQPQPQRSSSQQIAQKQRSAHPQQGTKASEQPQNRSPALQQQPSTVSQPAKATPVPLVPVIPRASQQIPQKQRFTHPQQGTKASAQPQTPPAAPQQQPSTVSQSAKATPVPLVPVIPRPPQHIQAQFTPHQAQQRVHQQNLEIPVSKQTSSHGFQATPGGSQTSKLYVQPTALTPSQRAAYQKVNDVLPDPRDSTASRNQSAYLTNKAIAANPDQRRKADEAVDRLQNQLEAIFEAEDQMQPDTSEAAPVRENQYFSTHDTDEGPALVLQAEAQNSLNTAFQKVVSCNRLDSLEVDRLTRIQRVCERSVSTLGSGSLSIGDDWSAEDILDWAARVRYADNGIVAARTLLHIMTGGSHRKELQSEDCLRIVLDALRTALDTCIIPVVELRSYLGEKTKQSPMNPTFAIAAENRTTLHSLVNTTTKTLSLLGDLFAKTDVDETGVSSLVYTCKMLIFAENAVNERDSALGIQIFESMRKGAMNVMAKIFTKYRDQRKFIIDEVLLSLEKLPANKQSARQYRLPDAKPIQLVSALLMRLVQSSAVISKKSTREDDDSSNEDEAEDSSEVEDSEESDEDVIAVGPAKKKAARKPATDLDTVYRPLQQECSNTAGHIASMLLQRAIGKSKSDLDSPFRRLLDNFTDDFINVLGSSDWPAAELLLRGIVGRLIPMADDQKQPAPSRTLALELLGTIGSGILDTLKATADSAKMTDDEDHVSQGLANIGSRAEAGDLDLLVVTSFEGPYRVLIEYLHGRNVERDPQLLSARGYHLVQWADMVLNMKTSRGDDQPTTSTTPLQNKIRCMMVDVNWLEDHSQFAQPSTTQGKLAARIVTASSSLCRALPRILQTILRSFNSGQPTVRSRALKSVTDLLEKDSEILDRNESVLRQIVRSLGDSSSLVRESALQLVQKCVALRPALELKVYGKIVERTTDASQNVRKRAMAFLKQVYLRTQDTQVRAKISDAMINRINDVDESVAEVARTTIEEIWFSAFRKVRGEGDRSVDSKLEMAGQAALIVQTVDLGDNIAAVLEALLKSLMTTSKQAADNKRISKAFVAILFEGLIDTSDIPGAPSQVAVLRTLTVFAKTAPGLFTPPQIELLGPYTRNLTNTDELEIFHFVVTILRFTMPGLPGLKVEFLQQLQGDLLQAVPKLPKSELSVVAPCLWTIDAMVGNRDRLVRFLASALVKVHGMQKIALSDDKKTASTAIKLMIIIGQFGKACQFDGDLRTFKGIQQLSWYKGDTAAGLMVEVCCKYTSPKQPMPVREAALETVCAVSHTYPKNYLRSDVVNAIEMIFDAREAKLEQVLLISLEEFFLAAERREADPDAPELGSGIESGAQRLGSTYQAEGADVALNSLCQRFLPHIMRLSTSSLDDVALCAARTVASISRQGLMNPVDVAPGLVALQTCPVPAIAKTAFLSYKAIFLKHPTALDKTALKSVHESWNYQRDIVKDASGFTGHPPTAKLHYYWEVLRKEGFAKSRTKFFDQVCGSLAFDPTKLTAIEKLRQHLMYVRYCVENMAFIDHDKVSEPLHAVACLEKAYAGAGLAVTQGIESDVFMLQIPVSSQAPVTSETLPNGQSDPIAVAQTGTISGSIVDPERLLQLATSAQILSLLIETRNFLRGLWLLKKFSDNTSKGKAKNAKDAEKNANRATNAPALTESYQSRIADIMAATEDEAGQRKLCSSFVELMTVDHEAKAASGDDDEDILMEDDDDVRREGSPSNSPFPRGKKRKPSDGQGGASKKRGRPRKSSFSKDDDDDGWE